MYDYQQNSNLPAIKRLIILVANPSSTATNNVAMAGSSFLKEIKFAKRSCDISYAESVSGSGKLYVASISAKLPVINPAFYEFMLYNSEARWKCLAEDFNNHLHIIGSDEAGAVLTIKGETSPNGYELNFSANSPYPFEIKNSTIMQSITTHTVIDIRRAAEADVYLESGTAFENEFTIYDAEGEVIDLTGGEFDLNIYKQGTVQKTYANIGSAPELSLIESNTKIAMNTKFDLAAGMYEYQLWQNKTGTSPQLLMKGLWIAQ